MPQRIISASHQNPDLHYCSQGVMQLSQKDPPVTTTRLHFRTSCPTSECAGVLYLNRLREKDRRSVLRGLKWYISSQHLRAYWTLVVKWSSGESLILSKGVDIPLWKGRGTARTATVTEALFFERIKRHAGALCIEVIQIHTRQI